jgi:hypothetical protein
MAPTTMIAMPAARAALAGHVAMRSMVIAALLCRARHCRVLYDSESSFSKAVKRLMGTAPGACRWRKDETILLTHILPE